MMVTVCPAFFRAAAACSWVALRRSTPFTWKQHIYHITDIYVYTHVCVCVWVDVLRQVGLPSSALHRGRLVPLRGWRRWRSPLHPPRPRCWSPGPSLRGAAPPSLAPCWTTAAVNHLVQTHALCASAGLNQQRAEQLCPYIQLLYIWIFQILIPLKIQFKTKRLMKLIKYYMSVYLLYVFM